MTCLSFYATSLLSSKAISKVIVSIYSISVPIVIPIGILDTLTLYLDKIFLIYCIVVSPSILGFKTTITSLTLSSHTLFTKLDKFISSGFIPSIGEIKPSKT